MPEVKTLEELFLLTPHQGVEWQSQNYFPDSKWAKDRQRYLEAEKAHGREHKLGLCPHAEIVSICAELAGVRGLSETEHYCGELFAERERMDFRSPGSRPDYFMACRSIAAFLNDQIRQCGAQRPKQELLDKLLELDPEERSKVLQQWDDHKAGQANLNRFRKVLDESTGLAGTSEVVALSRVELFLKALLSQAAGEDAVGFWMVESPTCQAAPGKDRPRADIKID